MGASTSSERGETTVEEIQKSNERKHFNQRTQAKKNYRLPEIRAKSRFEIQEENKITNAYEAAIDKYDYLIVFPLTEGPYANPIDKDSNPGQGGTVVFKRHVKLNQQLISWEGISTLWQAAIPGTDTQKLQAVATLKNYWQQRTGSTPENSDQIRVIAWLSIAREAIIDQLATKSGLQLKLSANSKNIFCRIRAPIKLLELHAAKLHYRLLMKGEIDPGNEFWNTEYRGKAVELEEERKMYTKDEANAILTSLYRAGKLLPSDLGVDEDKETQSTWTRRVHALERIADSVPVWNQSVPHIPFSDDKHLRYLYQTHSSIRGKTFFCAKDRLFLTKSIIDKYFNCSLLTYHDEKNNPVPVISSILALHDSNRGEFVTLDVLKRRWLNVWACNANEAGAPTVSHAAYNESVSIPWYLRPFSQPFKDIREYYGEKIALYYAWFGYYIFSLIIPTILGFIMEVVMAYRDYTTTTDNLDIPLFIFCISLMLWSLAYHLNWDTECKIISVKWGTVGFEDEEKDRPHFLPDPDQPTIRSPINNHKVINFPEHKRRRRVTLVYVIVLLCIAADLSVVSALVSFEYFLLRDYSKYVWLTWAPALFQAMLIRLNTTLFKPFVRYLTEFENHRTETEFEDNLVLKIVVFEVFNSYGALMYTAFVKDSAFSGCEANVCLSDLRQLLICIIIVRVTLNVLDLFIPSIQSLWCSDSSTGDNEENGLLSAIEDGSHDENHDYMLEVNRKTYNGPFDDYAYAVFQYGYIMLFSAALPLLPIIALIENMIKLRTDAFKLCKYCRRPDVQLAEDAGFWSDLMEYMPYIGIACNCAVLIFATTIFKSNTTNQKTIMFLVTQQVLMLTRVVMRHIFNYQPSWLKETIARNEYIENKYLHGIDDDDEYGGDQTNIKGNIQDNVDFEGLNLFDLRKAKPTTLQEYQQIETEEANRRKYLSELKYCKDKLVEVYKIETYNEVTGIGETKHGLPLGRLSVKILEIQNFYLTEKENKIKVRISFKPTKPGLLNVAPPQTALNDTKHRQLVNGRVEFNESVGPFAPIRSQDVAVVFDVLDMNKDSNDILASSSIKLRELQDQMNHDVVLHLSEVVSNAASRTEDAKLLATLKFEYSKVLPLRNKIYSIQDKLRQVEKKLAELKSGRKLDDIL